MRRRIPIDRVIGITFSATVVWCSRRGLIRHTQVWFFGSGMYADPSRPYREALAKRVNVAIRGQKRFHRKVMVHLDDDILAAQLLLARRGAGWSRRHRNEACWEGNHLMWEARAVRIEEELARRSRPSA
jgi:hypothetical protein